jgi:hypothetical protein
VRRYAVALAAGNALNAGTARGDAAGFTLDSLHKLSDVRSTLSRSVDVGGSNSLPSQSRAAPADSAPAAASTLLDFIVAVADERILKLRALWDMHGDGGDAKDTVQEPSLATELKSCAAGGRWSQNDLASALARIDMGVQQVRAEAEAAAARAAIADNTPSPADITSGSNGGGNVEERRCAEVLARFLGGADTVVTALREQAASVDGQYRALCAYVGEGNVVVAGGGGGGKAGTVGAVGTVAGTVGTVSIPPPPPPPPPPPLPPPPGAASCGGGGVARLSSSAAAAGRVTAARGAVRDPEEVFGSLWAFARAVDAARANRKRAATLHDASARMHRKLVGARGRR